ncbi:hypothetical protein ADT26_21805 [Xanthomonas oryzae]|uniref:hypothetical protein n=1 Tax=Xanthomonas oryzae TaxID=347 RepID=UPI0006AC1AAC|nr:hypothetical protein [Xanthomonas oryzae]ALS94461.1 hypothetical protein AXO1947_07930 [Xanthomonas oryzae pv. oryzae]AVU03268.1 hypothetical protein C0L90_13730 [Xanthomonas oryzae pv. oryzae]KOR38674.1 hypothetical protein ADT26_21805 [Xanthomonas oryzae]QBI16482.1 hypothetical protein EYR03_14010 [Xanthomonas oryzae pv. oryzae]QBN24627.1 hypothetical protein EBA00_08855 [Xanthomonas oryzae pv. oryzae]
MSLPAAIPIFQSRAFGLAAITGGLTAIRSVLPAGLASRQLDPQRWWQTNTARAGTRHATDPMHWAIAALVIGAALPQPFLMLAAT